MDDWKGRLLTFWGPAYFQRLLAFGRVWFNQKSGTSDGPTQNCCALRWRWWESRSSMMCWNGGWGKNAVSPKKVALIWFWNMINQDYWEWLAASHRSISGGISYWLIDLSSPPTQTKMEQWCKLKIQRGFGSMLVSPGGVRVGPSNSLYSNRTSTNFMAIMWERWTFLIATPILAWGLWDESKEKRTWHLSIW